MKALIIVAHGSRLETSNEEIIALSNKVQENTNKNLLIKSAFLELAKPGISDCISDCIENENVSEIDVFPYFLAAGVHVKVDIPDEINLLKSKYPHININLLPHLGKCDGLINVILDTQST